MCESYQTKWGRISDKVTITDILLKIDFSSSLLLEYGRVKVFLPICEILCENFLNCFMISKIKTF